MLPPDLARQIRRLHIRARRAVESLVGGEYQSVFKGVGLAFEEVRAYHPGDDVRAIDWNVTARMGQPYVKRYVEERELTVLLLFDGSASQRFGSGRLQKRDVLAELAAILALSAVVNKDLVGLLLFTDRVEHFVRPRKGFTHMLRLIRDLFSFQPEHAGTSLTAALDFLNRVQPRRAIVFLLSDFVDRDFEHALNQTARRHELILINITDPLELDLPSVGLVELEDAETGERLVVSTRSGAFRTAFAGASRDRQESLLRIARACRADIINVSTAGGHLDCLVKFFRLRERRLRRTRGA